MLKQTYTAKRKVEIKQDHAIVKLIKIILSKQTTPRYAESNDIVDHIGENGKVLGHALSMMETGN